MGQVETLLSIVILLIVSFSSFFIFNYFYIDSVMLDYENTLELQEYKYNMNKFETLLLLEDPYSNNNFFIDSVALLSNNNYYYTPNNGMVSVDLWYKKQLDLLYGENNYYFEFDYEIKNLSMVFLYDDGDFIKNVDEREDFSQILLDLYEKFDELGINFKADVYILTDDRNSNECQMRYLSLGLQNLNCRYIYMDNSGEFYSSLIEDPYQLFYVDATADIRSNIESNYNIYAKNDWSNFVLKVLDQYGGRASLYTSRVTLFYLSDVVNLGYPSNSITQTYLLARYSQVCERFTDYTISDYGVNILADYLNDSYYSVFPIVVWDNNADLVLESTMRYYYSDILRQPYPAAGYCNQPVCPACVGTSGNIQYHPESRTKHLEQLNKVAQSSKGGSVIMYSQGVDLGTLIEDYMSTIVESTSFSIGQKQDGKKQILQKSMTLNVNGEPVTFNAYLEVYENPYNFTQELN